MISNKGERDCQGVDCIIAKMYAFYASGGNDSQKSIDLKHRLCNRALAIASHYKGQNLDTVLKG